MDDLKQDTLDTKAVPAEAVSAAGLAALTGSPVGWHAEYLWASDRAMRMEIERNDAKRDRDEWKASCALYHKTNEALDKDRSKLLAAIRKLRDAKGDAANQDAYEEMIALLPENNEVSGAGATASNDNTKSATRQRSLD